MGTTGSYGLVEVTIQSMTAHTPFIWQIRFASFGASGTCFFAGVRFPDIEIAYQAADIFLLSPRLDPLPNVAIDAMANGSTRCLFLKRRPVLRTS